MFLLTSFVLYAFALQVVHALPLVKRIVVSPQITSPSAGTVWTPGDTVVVTWDTSAIPSTGNFPGQLVLGFQTSDSENLDVDHPLAEGFSLRDGSVSVTCPQVAPKNNYIVVLFGDSGNRSPPFTISGPPANGNSDPPASSTVPVKPEQVSTTLTTSASPSPVAQASGSDPSTPSQTPSTPVTTPTPVSPAAAYATSSTSSSKGSSASPAAPSSSSVGSNSPAANLNTNSAIPRTWNAGIMVACAVVTVVTIFTF